MVLMFGPILVITEVDESEEEESEVEAEKVIYNRHM